MLQKRWRDVLVVHRNRDMKLGARLVKKPGMTALLMVNIKSPTLKRRNYLLRLQDRQL
jgi:hypothetical protein